MTTPTNTGAAPRNLTVRRTPEFAEDLAVLTGTVQSDGTALSATAAVHLAVQLLADAVRRAHDYGDVPEGTMPAVVSVRYRTAHGTPETVPHDPPHDGTVRGVVREVPAHGAVQPATHDSTAHDVVQHGRRARRAVPGGVRRAAGAVHSG